MLYCMLFFLMAAIIAGLLGFKGAALVASGIAAIVLLLFLALFVVALVKHLAEERAGDA